MNKQTTSYPEGKIESFERAFSASTNGCIRTCDCGKVYFNPNGDWDWEDGELERLEKNPKNISLEYAPSDITFEGRRVVDACDCWHDRAVKIMAFIDSHAHKIAKYLELEKKRKQAEADNVPIVTI